MKKINFLTAGVLNSSQIYAYKTKDSRAIFQFSYHYLSGGFYEVDIHQQPSYQNRSTDINTIHRLSSPRTAKHKICFTSGKEPKTLSDSQKYSTDWAELTWEYIKSGVTIDNQIRRRSN